MMRLLAPEYAFGWAESLLLAAIMSSTDSASVFSILNSSGIGLKQRLKPTLELESGSNDPMAYLLVVLLISVIESGSEITGGLVVDTLGQLALQLSVGVVAGWVIGMLSVKAINSIRSENDFMYPVLVVACCFFAFTITGLVGGNSYLAVYIAGVVVGNKRIVLKRTITTFFGGFTWLVQIAMFITLGLLVNPHELVDIVWPGLLLGVFMIVIARPVAVLACLLPFKCYTPRAKAYICWVGLRGAVPIIFATYALMSPAVEHARFMFNLVFFITMLSLLIQGTTVNSMARRLKLTEPLDEPHFNVELPDEVASDTREYTIEAQHLANGDLLREATLPADTLAILLHRDNRYLVPKGDTRLQPGDVLLLVRRK